MAQPFISMIIYAGCNFAPRNWATCSGQLMAIQQNTALFSLLGTNFGGNGTTTFGLPDLRGRVPVGTGQGPGLSDVVIGEMAGTENTTLLISNMPQHTHTATFTQSTGVLNAATTKASLQLPAANVVLGRSVDGSGGTALPEIYCPAGTSTSVGLAGVAVTGTVTTGISGSSIPFSIQQPFLGLTAIIAIFGIFPSRN